MYSISAWTSLAECVQPHTPTKANAQVLMYPVTFQANQSQAHAHTHPSTNVEFVLGSTSRTSQSKRIKVKVLKLPIDDCYDIFRNRKNKQFSNKFRMGNRHKWNRNSPKRWMRLMARPIYYLHIWLIGARRRVYTNSHGRHAFFWNVHTIVTQSLSPFGHCMTEPFRVEIISC